MISIRLVCAALLAVALSACAATTAENAPNDPFEQQNRAVFKANQWLDRNVVYPSAVAYVAVVPEPARDRVHDFLGNLDTPRIFANDLLQGEFDRAGHSFYRFGINSTIGVAGLWDAAAAFGVPGHSEDLGQTLAVWGASDGPFLMVPVIGPSNPRDLTGFVGDFYLDPFTYVHMKQHIWWQAARTYAGYLDVRARNLNTLTGIERGSVDYYASVRSLYRQSRKDAIANGKSDNTDLPDF